MNWLPFVVTLFLWPAAAVLWLIEVGFIAGLIP